MKSNLATLILLFCWFVPYAKLPEKAVGKPKIFSEIQKDAKLKAIFAENKFLQKTEKKYWKVFSDRENNVTYSNFSGDGIIQDKLNFMELVTIAEVQKNWAHVYTEESGQIWPAISPNAKDRGWIKMENLLLSYRCLANESGFTQKAMVLTDLSVLETGDLNPVSKEFFIDPDLNKKSGNLAKTFEIYFVFKKTRNSVLLAKDDVVPSSTEEVKGSVLGWMKNASITFWDHRICLEPNWTESALNEYQDFPIAVFGRKEQAWRYYKNGNADSAIRIRKLEGKRASGEIKRSPLIEIDKTNVYLKKVGTIGSLSALGEMQLGALEHKLQQVNDKIKNINILFVIDGRNSMKQFYDPVSQGIAASMRSLLNQESRNRFKFGAVIYRDYNSKPFFELEPLTDDHQKVIGFLNKTVCSGDNRNAPALFNGLIEGIKNAGFEKDQSNFIILVGDVANREPDARKLTPQQVVDLMVEYQCSMVGFQVNSKNDPVYYKFMDHIENMVIETARTLTKGKDNTGDLISWKKISNNQYAIQQKNNEKKEQESLIVAGRCYVAPINGSFEFKSLENAVVSTIEDYNTRVNEQKAFIDKILNLSTGDFTPIVISMLRNRGFSEFEIGQIRTAEAIRVEGWTSDMISGKKNPCYLPVAFLTNSELSEFIRICSKLGSELTTSERRATFQKSLIQECKTLTGDYSSSAEKEIENKSLDDVWKILFGIPFSSKELGKVKIKNITSRSKLSDPLMEQFVERFNAKVKIMKSISPTSYPYRFKTSDQTYYWIDLEELP